MPQFTPQNAKEMAQRSAEARRLNRQRAEEAALLPPQVAQSVPQAAEDTYVLTRLLRVRGHLDRIDRMMASEQDPKRLRDLAAVTRDLEEQERRLSGRPLPGSKRPRPEPAKKISSAPAPLD